MTAVVAGPEYVPTSADALARRLVPDEVWAIARPLLPPTRPRSQGGGRPRSGERECLTAVVFVIASGGSWRSIPASLGVAVATAHRRFVEWTARGLWHRLEDEVRLAGCDGELVAWVSAIADAATRRERAVAPPT